ncbi:hemolysin family protein [Tersicoccus sp. Bi-70]|uniref:hemolysin family protein n=1 Tax=Tersicoccus sp. Bi-70 TaxID=1897634 RepID=UPI000976C283|nr:hemolysin family protein [Tersicoccus sp. Bi-70]OMH37057.1 HCC family HlyC/CorC transporter [Tersicoccus sp. Bi-70]
MTVALLFVLVVVVLVGAAIMAAAEAAFTYLPRHDAEAALGGRNARSLRQIIDEPARHMHATRFWRVWFEMAAAVAVAMLLLGAIGNPWVAGLIGTVVMAAIGFVLVGVSPRQLGRTYSVGVVTATAPLVHFLCVILGPVPGWLISVGSLVTPGAPRADAAFFTEDELREMVYRANESEMIEDNEAELIHSVFDLNDTKVRAVMVPRTDIVGIETGATLREALSLFLRSGYSRVPVMGQSTDDPRGVLYLKDVVAAVYGAERAGMRETADPGTATVDTVARPVRFVPESKPVADLLSELQREGTHVAIVIDEYGGTAGMVTLEDLIEEIVGEIVDEYDSERPEIEDLGDGRYRISAKLAVEDLGELFDMELEDDEVDTVGGLLGKALGKVPIVGSETRIAGIDLYAERLEGRRNRVSHLIARLAEPVPSPAETAEDPSGHHHRVDASHDAARPGSTRHGSTRHDSTSQQEVAG